MRYENANKCPGCDTTSLPRLKEGLANAIRHLRGAGEDSMNWKPKVYIEARPGRDWLGRSNHLWRGTNPYGNDFYLGAVHLFSVEETLTDYCKRLNCAKKRAMKAVAR